jgi:tripartite-type tricarboxylate transporter receptor subunit TctC
VNNNAASLTALTIAVAAVHGVTATAASGDAQQYPYKPIRILTSGTGGDDDFLTRIVAQGISGPLGQQLIVDNRPAGAIPGQIVAGSQPDGYTLLSVSGSLWTGQFLRKNMPFDPVRDFAPIMLIAKGPNILLINPSVAASSVKELISAAKAKPGALNYAAGAPGSSSHLSAELFKTMTGTSITGIYYKSGGLRQTALLGNEVQIEFGSPLRMPLVKAGKVKALAVTSLQASALAPGLPTVASSVPGFESVSISGLWAPAKTPAAVINRLNQELTRLLANAEVKDKLLAGGVEAVGSTPAEFAAVIKADIVKMGKVIRDAGIQPE